MSPIVLLTPIYSDRNKVTCHTDCVLIYINLLIYIILQINRQYLRIYCVLDSVLSEQNVRKFVSLSSIYYHVGSA